MAYGEGNFGYVECPNCDIFYNADDNDSCPLCAVNEQALDLLDACKAIVRAEKKAERGSLIEFYAAVDAARKAIAKAEGKSA